MENSLIKYKTSDDYDRLYDLLKAGYVLIGFIAIDIDGVPSDRYSKLVSMSYNSESKFFDLGFILFESDFDKDGFKRVCLKQNVRFIELN